MSEQKKFILRAPDGTLRVLRLYVGFCSEGHQMGCLDRLAAWARRVSGCWVIRVEDCEGGGEYTVECNT